MKGAGISAWRFQNASVVDFLKSDSLDVWRPLKIEH